MKVLRSLFITINVITFIMFALDKWKAKFQSFRISERTLCLLGLFGGYVGGLIAMVFLAHKCRKLTFVLKFIGSALIGILITSYVLRI